CLFNPGRIIFLPDRLSGDSSVISGNSIGRAPEAVSEGPFQRSPTIPGVPRDAAHSEVDVDAEATSRDRSRCSLDLTSRVMLVYLDGDALSYVKSRLGSTSVFYGKR